MLCCSAFYAVQFQNYFKRLPVQLGKATKQQKLRICPLIRLSTVLVLLEYCFSTVGLFGLNRSSAVQDDFFGPAALSSKWTFHLSNVLEMFGIRRHRTARPTEKSAKIWTKKQYCFSTVEYCFSTAVLCTLIAGSHSYPAAFRSGPVPVNW